MACPNAGPLVCTLVRPPNGEGRASGVRVWVVPSRSALNFGHSRAWLVGRAGCCAGAAPWGDLSPRRDRDRRSGDCARCRATAAAGRKCAFRSGIGLIATYATALPTRSIWLPLLGWWSHILIDVLRTFARLLPGAGVLPVHQMGLRRLGMEHAPVLHCKLPCDLHGLVFFGRA